MKRNRNPVVYLRHVLDAIYSIEEYTSGFSHADFIQQRPIQDAVIRQIEIIGEALKRVPASVRSSAPEIPWQDITGMRDRLIHDYFAVDIESVWQTVQRDIPGLKDRIHKLLTKYSG
ncbi:MAG: hypothetical protein A3H42_01270 [Deltaproteobacteria bacterium RIFCSPLOWO2_02_FULL_46_8]|nr:MAG: hypothetical protein A3H42_01270 [Deltaproteobacteria bacterium RIFCSPLOWO2_02_FULL_46_8]